MMLTHVTLFYHLAKFVALKQEYMVMRSNQQYYTSIAATFDHQPSGILQQSDSNIATWPF